MRSIILSIFVLLFVPLHASAMEMTTWSFTNFNVPGNWNIRALTAPEPSENGLVINTETDGSLTRETHLLHPIDVISVTVQSNSTLEALLIWKNTDVSTESYVQLPFVIEAKEGLQTIDLELSNYPFWHPQTEEFGFLFPAGTNLTIESVQMKHWNIFENIAEGFKSMWKFDKMQLHSINFLWGPQITLNPFATEYMHRKDPPFGFSVNWIFYVLIVVTGAFTWIFQKKIHAPVAVFGLILLGMWIFYDVRMGMELLSYANEDFKTYTSQEEGEKEFRDMVNFHDVINQAAPHLEGSGKYFFFGPEPNAFLSILRYYTYPDVPIRPSSQAVDEATMALIFSPISAVVTEGGDLLVDDTYQINDVILVKQIDETSFIVRLSK